MQTTEARNQSAASRRWRFCVESIPPVGVHRTAGRHVEQTFKLARFQHFDGEMWGAVAHDSTGAAALAGTPSQFPPTYWLAPEEDQV